MEDPRNKGKSFLHWENKAARQCLETQQHILVAEMIREYLEFYGLDYSKQIFMPETNLNTHPETSRSDIA
jgi:hypothetical protein